jgi:hypothetical protein
MPQMATSTTQDHPAARTGLNDGFRASTFHYSTAVE